MTKECAIWIGAYEDGDLFSGKYRHKFPTPPFVIAAIGPAVASETCFGLGGGRACPTKSSYPKQGGFPVLALALLSSFYCLHDDGYFTSWDYEGSLLLDYHENADGYPLDCYTLSAKTICPLKKPVFLTHKCGRSAGTAGYSKILLTTPLFHGHWSSPAAEIELESGGHSRPDQQRHACKGDLDIDDDLDYSHGNSARAVLNSWNMANCDPDQLPVLLLPFPYWLALKSGNLDKLLISLRWHKGLHGGARGQQFPGPLAGWPPCDAPVWKNVGKRGRRQQDEMELVKETKCEMTDPSAINYLQGDIRDWVSRLGSLSDDREVSEI